jgi:hypothetical protein
LSWVKAAVQRFARGRRGKFTPSRSRGQHPFYFGRRRIEFWVWEKEIRASRQARFEPKNVNSGAKCLPAKRPQKPVATRQASASVTGYTLGAV